MHRPPFLPNRPTFLIWATLLAFYVMPSLACAAERDRDREREQVAIFISKAIGIIDPVVFWSIVVGYFVLLYLATVLSARICFGSESVWWRTIKSYVLTWVAVWLVSIVGVFAAFLAGMAVQGAELFILFIVFIAVVVLVFWVPMKVFDAVFLNVLGFYIVSTILCALAASLSARAAGHLIVTEDRIPQFKALLADAQNGALRKDKDYAKIDDLEKQFEMEATPAKPSLAEQAMALKARFASLKERFAKLDKTNAAEVTQYNADYKQYTDDMNAYNARVKAAQPAPATP